jgi:hypothetical protein
MKNAKSVLWVLMGALSLLITACSSSQKMPDQSGLKDLSRSMAGSYTSAAQAAADTNYLDISLHMIPIWPATAYKWLYVEQALTSKPERPYRQRIYQLEQVSKDEFKTTVYEISNPKECIGKWRNPSFFDQFDQSILIERDGCAVFLRKTGPETYEGSTKDDACKSSLYGASYATSIVFIKAGLLTSWDQGFDADGHQVWGATEGPYQFVKIPTD